MNEENFTFWLQGFFELTDSKELTPAQVKMIKEHLVLVFVKETPELGPTSATRFDYEGYLGRDPLVKLC